MMNLRQKFSDRVHKSAFHNDDGNWLIIGKWAELEIVCGAIDVFLIQPGRVSIPARKLNNLCRALHRADGQRQIAIRDGEAWFQTDDLTDEELKLLGIRKKTRYSEETKRKMRERLKPFHFKGQSNDQ